MPDPTRVLLDFSYAAIVDVLKTLMTLASGVFVVSVTFADKIVEVHSANKFGKFAVIVVWALLILSIICGFFALQFLLIANANIRLERDFGAQMQHAVTYMGIASFLFVIALITLAGTATYSLMRARQLD